jgi:tetratricopeptide (TPR) repeat protein
MARIYISSTFQDLKDYRGAVYHALRQMQHDVISMEDYTAGDQRPLDKCLADVGSCHIYVGIFAWRYGYVPSTGNPRGKSITELEYHKAAEVKIPRLVFLLDPSVPWPRSMMDEVTGEGAGGAHIRRLRDTLGEERLRAVFKAPEDLAREVSVAIHNIQQKWTAEDLETERKKLAEESERRSRRAGLRVVGQHLLDVAHFFKGRMREQRELGRLLADRSTRVVSVIGRPGIGKTALASKVLGDLEHNRWPHTEDRLPVDGIVYLSIRDLSNSLERLFLECAALLGGDEESALVKAWACTHLSLEEKCERLLEALDEGLYVILLDHMEDLLDADGQILDRDLKTFFERSLASPHGARLLLTSRSPLAFEPRLLRFDRRVALTDGLSVAEGVAFLRELDASGDCGLNELPDDALARAVSRLHGIPRSLEALAGMKSKAGPFSTLDDILDGFYQANEVEQFVKEAYLRLDQSEHRVIDALAVLGRPVPVVAVQFIVEDIVPVLSVEAVLRILIRIHMVNHDRATKAVALNPIDQDFAYRQIPESGIGGRQALERRAGDYYAQLRVPRSEWRTVMDSEPHLLEFEHRLRARDFEAAAEGLCQVDVRFLVWRGYARRIQGMLMALEGKIQDPRCQMLHAYALGQTYLYLGPLEQAVRSMSDARDAARVSGDQEVERQAIAQMGEASRRLGRLDDAIKFLTEAVRLTRPDSPADNFRLLLSLAYSYRRRFDEAFEWGQSLMDSALKEQDEHRQAQAHDALALACLGLGKHQEALAHTTEASKLYSAQDARDPLGYVLNVQGMIHLSADSEVEAIHAFEQGRRRGRDDDNPRLEAFCLFNLARVFLRQGDNAEALGAAKMAHAIFLRIGAAEIGAAGALLEALEATATGDRTAHARALLDCARRSWATADLCDPADLLIQAEAVASTGGLSELLVEIANTRHAMQSGQLIAEH